MNPGPPARPRSPALARRALLLGPIALARPAAAQSVPWPDRPVRILSGFTPSGPNDAVNRRIAQSFTEVFGQPFVIDNRMGAGGNIAMDLLAKSPPDGATLCSSPAGPVVFNPIMLGPRLPYDPARDILPVTRISQFPFALFAHNSVPSGRDEFIAWLRRHPEEFFGSPGVGSTGHLLGAKMSRSLGVRLQHVAYRSFAVADLVEGRLKLALQSVPAVVPVVAQGRARAVFVTGRARSPLLPDVPTFAEAGMPELTTLAWYGLFAPAGLPEAIAGRIRAQAGALLHSPEVSAWMRAFGLDPATDPAPGEFGHFLDAERDHWRRVIAEVAPGLL